MPAPERDNQPDAVKNRVKVVAAQESLITVDIAGAPIRQNEVAYVCVGEDRLKAEVLRIQGGQADLQVFEDTQDVRIGDDVELTGEMLSVSLGPGLLGTIFDGLQNPLTVLAEEHGFFLPRGRYPSPLDPEARWHFRATVSLGDTVQAGDTLGVVPEKRLEHRIMVPFDEAEPLTVRWLRASDAPGAVHVDTPIAKLERSDGSELDVTLQQRWAIRRPLPDAMLRRRITQREYPDTPLTTTVRIIDTLFPVAKGGTACIPGPFGAGKTVLQSLIARYADVDVVVIVACGERAGEVVETITEFPEYRDPRTGGSLMERTIIVCNTSSMPVAARESSIYTGMTLGEYYRQMGYSVLVIADSTSRWAQALREMSNRMEELPGPDAFPMDLPAIISNFYARAGMVHLNNGKTGSITFIGTVSPAGGNLKEPVTESTKKVARCFYALSQSRADSKRYPAIDPIESYSKYLEYPELQRTLNEQIEPGWTDKVNELKNILLRGKEAAEQINILGDDGVSIDTHLIFWRSEVVDEIILQQNAFDDVDARTPLDRQQYMVNKVLEVVDTPLSFEGYEEINPYFKRVINAMKQMNYSEFESKEFKQNMQELEDTLAERKEKT
jgi:V/A-type H+-transporting ATPase subunit A